MSSHATVVDQTTVVSPDLQGRSVRPFMQRRVRTQNIWGAFDPHTERIVGVQISGESIYQNVANALIAETQAGVRMASRAATQTVLTLGKLVQGDSQGGDWVAVLGDAMGNVITGNATGTTLTVDNVLSGPPILLGLTLGSGRNGVALAKLIAFGSGVGGTGTYTLDTALDVPTINTFTLDDDGVSYLVSVDGTRWVPRMGDLTLNELTINPQPGDIGLTVNGSAGEPAALFVQNSAPGSVAWQGLSANGSAVLRFDAAGNALIGSAEVAGTCLISSNIPRLCVDAHGALTYGPPDVVTHNSVQFSLNGDGTGADFLIWGPTDGENSLELRAISDGVNAYAEIGVADGGSYGLYIVAAAPNYAGALLTNGPVGKNTALLTNYVSNLTLGTNRTAAFNITPTQEVQGWGYLAQEFVDMTPDFGSFTGVYTGFATNISGQCRWVRIGMLVTLVLPVGSGASNANTFELHGLPAEIQPADIPQQWATAATNSGQIFNNGVAVTDVGIVVDAASDTITFTHAGTGDGWTASGTKGVYAPLVIHYLAF